MLVQVCEDMEMTKDNPRYQQPLGQNQRQFTYTPSHKCFGDIPLKPSSLVIRSKLTPIEMKSRREKKSVLQLQ